MFKRIKLSLLILSFLFAGTTPALAHPADVYTHVIHVDLSQEAISLKWEIKPGPMLIPFLWSEADTDLDGNVTREEADLWAGPRIAKFSAALNDMPLNLKLERVVFPSSQDAFQSGQEF